MSCIPSNGVTPLTFGIVTQVVFWSSRRTDRSTSLKDVTFKQFPDAKNEIVLQKKEIAKDTYANCTTFIHPYVYNEHLPCLNILFNIKIKCRYFPYLTKDMIRGRKSICSFRYLFS